MKTLSFICTSFENKDDQIQEMVDSVNNVMQYCPYFDYHITVVDNSISLKTNNFDNTTIIQPTENLGYCSGNNLAIDSSTGDIIIIINPDVILKDSLCIDWMVGTIGHYKKCITGTMIGSANWYTYPASFPTDKQYDVKDIPFYFDEPTHTKPGNWKAMKYIDGCLMAFPRHLFEVSSFDGDIFPGYFGETAFAFSAYLNGYSIKDCAIKGLYDHKSNHDDNRKRNIREWTKEGRDIFYTKYAIPNWEMFNKYLGE